MSTAYSRNTGRGQNTMNRVVWLAFLSHIEKEPHRFNGRPISETMSRSLHRWRHDNSCPSFFTCDEWLVKIGLHIGDFFDWAEDRDLDPWLYGEPDWHKETD